MKKISLIIILSLIVFGCKNKISDIDDCKCLEIMMDAALPSGMYDHNQRMICRGKWIDKEVIYDPKIKLGVYKDDPVAFFDKLCEEQKK